MTTTQLVLSVLAFSSPLVCLSGYFALTIMSTGQTAPVAFIIVTAVLMVFSVGYMAMTRHMPRPGAFYAYISEGLGRHLGLASAFLATLSYTVILMGVYCFGGLTISGLISTWAGPSIPWWLTALGVWVIVAFLGYFNVEVSAKVLMWVMFVEVTTMMVFNVAVFDHGGQDGLSAAPFDVFAFASGEKLWVGMLFAMLVFIGFEATALYRDEVRDPDRTIPRATYIAVLFIGVLYTVTVWIMVIAFGADAEKVATEDTAGMFGIAASRYVGSTFRDVATALVITAVLASLLSIHNAATRYTFNLAADAALPRLLARVHDRHNSPYAASLGISALSLLGVIPFVLTNNDPAVTYAQLAGLGNAGVFILMALVSVAVVVFFRRHPTTTPHNTWATMVAPSIAAIAMTSLVAFALANFDLVVGASSANTLLLAVLATSFSAGLVVAAVMKARRPAAFLKLGGVGR
ncbi:APC family permease [Mycolicibacterium sp. P9-64]|uniref:APC family permease n=1 Tax=Mycolicibacterium sp. P9-64 TaxID=2024612 RepID=UPI00156327EC|nr:APC family permease [Mycolicibacterium sp. P9-64]